MKKIIKKLILLMWFLFVWSFFIWNSFTFADPAWANIKKSADTPKTADTNLWLYQTLWRSLYTITWPLIVIAGQFMDNQVVYGSFVGMDTLLWKIWNVMRTFANYIIWLILIFSIFTLFLGWKLEQFNPIKIIPQLVVSAVLVNASWFLIWACIDVSNILTYSLGTLPMKVAWDKIKNFNKQTIPTFWISLQSRNKPLQTGIYSKGKILPFCEIKALSGDNWIKYIWTTWWCVVAENMKYYPIPSAWITLKNWETLSWKWITPIKWKTFSEIEKKLWWMTWILWTLYASITNLWADVNYNSGSATSMSMELILKLLFLFALVIPLFTLAILLIVRVVVLWMFIIISPIVFLFTSVKSFEKFLWEKWKLSALCCMVFMPVIVVFALSISFVFLSSLKNMQISNEFWITGKWNTVYININWTKDNPKNDIQMTFKWFNWDSSMNSLFLQLWDTLSWIIRSIFSIWFMWVIVFAALKSCKITGWIASSIQNFSQSVAKATPIIPTWVAGGQSISSLWAWLEQINAWPKTKQQKQFQSGIWEIIKEYQRNTSWTWDAHYIAQTSNAVSTKFDTTTGVLKTTTEDKGYTTFKSTYKDKTISDLLDPKNSKELGAVATSLNISSDKLKQYLKSLQKDGKKGPLGKYIKNKDSIFDIELWENGGKPIDTILKNDATLSDVATAVKVDKDILKSMLNKISDKAKKLLSSTGSSFTGIEAIKQARNLTQLKKILKNNLINWSVTMLQLPDADKAKILTIFQKNWFTDVSSISQNENLAKALKQMWFSDDDIIMLLASKIEWTGIEWVPAWDVKAIKKLLN